MTSHRFGYLLFGIITMLTLYGCESKENSKSPTFNSKYYSFDTDMINLQMKEGDRGKIFQKIEENGVLKDQQYSVLLSSEEYWQILSVFMEEIEGEQLSNWSVDEIAYFGKCSEVYQGFGSINIWIFKQKRNLLYVDIIKKSIEIVPGYGYLEYFDEKSQKFPLGLKYIKLESINISPEDALKIADQNGAEVIRKSTNNECYTTIYSQNNNTYNGWMVKIKDSDFLFDLFISIVDFDTGRFGSIEVK